jgi:hypothetical protein
MTATTSSTALATVQPAFTDAERLPAGMVQLSGRDRIERNALAPGESFSSPMRVRASAPGHYQLSSPNFSYRDHLGHSQHMAGFIAEISVDPEQKAPPVPRLSAELLTAALPLDAWDTLRGCVTNVGESDVSDLEVTLSGQVITTERGNRCAVGRLTVGDSEDLEFQVRAREVGDHVPVHLNLSYRGPGGRHREETEHTVQVGSAKPESRARETMKILFLGANPPDLPRLRIDEEIREIEKEIRLGRERDRIRIETRWAVQGPDISRALLDVEPEFVHFAGHGGGGEESFAAEDQAGKTIVLPLASLVELFETIGENVRCVLVNGAARPQLVGGTAPRVCDRHAAARGRQVGDQVQHRVLPGTGGGQARGAGLPPRAGPDGNGA